MRFRDKKRCLICQNDGEHAHHLFSRKRLSTRWKLENGITLCAIHHNWAHHNKPDFVLWLYENFMSQREYKKLKAISGLIQHDSQDFREQEYNTLFTYLELDRKEPYIEI